MEPNCLGLFEDLKRTIIRAALIKQHKNVFGKRRSLGYAVSPFCRSLSKEMGSNKMVLPSFKVLSCAVIQLFSTVGATDNAGKHICLSRPYRAVFVLSLFLHPFPRVSADDGFVSVLKHKPLFLWIITGFLVLVGLFAGL